MQTTNNLSCLENVRDNSTTYDQLFGDDTQTIQQKPVGDIAKEIYNQQISEFKNEYGSVTADDMFNFKKSYLGTFQERIKNNGSDFEINLFGSTNAMTREPVLGKRGYCMLDEFRMVNRTNIKSPPQSSRPKIQKLGDSSFLSKLQDKTLKDDQIVKDEGAMDYLLKAESSGTIIKAENIPKLETKNTQIYMKIEAPDFSDDSVHLKQQFQQKQGAQDKRRPMIIPKNLQVQHILQSSEEEQMDAVEKEMSVEEYESPPKPQKNLPIPEYESQPKHDVSKDPIKESETKINLSELIQARQDSEMKDEIKISSSTVSIDDSAQQIMLSPLDLLIKYRKLLLATFWQDQIKRIELTLEDENGYVQEVEHVFSGRQIDIVDIKKIIHKILIILKKQRNTLKKSTGHLRKSCQLMEDLTALQESSKDRSEKQINKIRQLGTYIAKAIIYCDYKTSDPDENRVRMTMICRYYLLQRQCASFARNVETYNFKDLFGNKYMDEAHYSPSSIDSDDKLGQLGGTLTLVKAQIQRIKVKMIKSKPSLTDLEKKNVNGQIEEFSNLGSQIQTILSMLDPLRLEIDYSLTISQNLPKDQKDCIKKMQIFSTKMMNCFFKDLDSKKKSASITYLYKVFSPGQNLSNWKVFGDKK